MNNVTKVIIAIVVLGLIVWAISAISGNEKVAEANSYKIGFISPLSGDAAIYGEPGRNVVALAVEEINNAGGINGKQLEVIYEDGKCNGKDGASAMQKLVNTDKVEVVIGGFCSSESLAAAPIAESSKVALISPGSSSPDLTGKSPYFFRNYPSDASQGSVLAEVAFNNKKWKKVAFIQEQLDYPLGIYKAFEARFTELGGQVTKEEFAPEATDFRSQLSKIKAQNPDALFIDTQAPAATERILKQMQELKWKPNLIVSDVVPGDPKTVENNKAALEGALAAEFGTDPNNLVFQHLLTAYKEKYGHDLPYQSYGQTEYDAVFMVADAIMSVGYDGEKIAQWSRTVKDWQGASGNITILPTGDRASGHVPKMIKNGKVELFTP